MRTIESGDTCENEGCTHPATGLWTGDGGALAITRDYMQFKWCECCMLTVQVAHARERVKALANLEEKLAKACQ